MTEDDATNLAADDAAFAQGVDDPSVDGDGTPDFAPLETEGEDEEASIYEDLEEVSHDGKTFTIPKALKPALMMQADYTRKTQELAQARRTWEQERAQQVQALESNLHTRVQLATIYASMAELDAVDWRGLAEEDPEQAEALWAHYAQLHHARDETMAAMEQHGWEEALEAQRDHAIRLQDGLDVLSREIDGWSPELAGELAQFGHAELGFTPEELSQVMDPRLIKLLHRAYQGATRDWQSRRVAGLSRAQRTQPAPTLRGASGAMRVSADTSDFAAFERLADARLK